MMSDRITFGQRSMKTAVAAVASCYAAVASAQSATTVPVPVRLEWTRASGAETCPDAAVVEADVTARLGTNPFDASASEAIVVNVTRARGEWTALIEERPNDGPPVGSRVVTSSAESCESLALAAGLAIALTIRARASSESTPSKSAPASPVVAAAPSAPAPPPRGDESEAAEAGHVGIFASVVEAFGILPRAALGASMSGRVPLADSASIHGSITFLPEQRTRAANEDVAFGATFGALGTCYDSSFIARLRLSACAFLSLGARHIVVWNPTPVRPGARVWAAASMGLRLDAILLGPLRLLAGVEAFAPFERRSYVVERDTGTETAFAEPAWGGIVGAGLGVEL